MRADSPWPGLLIRLFLLGVASLLLGWLIGNFAAGILIAALGYLGWHLDNLLRLERWLRAGSLTDPPKSRGLWGEIFDALYRYQQRHRQRRRHLAGLLGRFKETANAMPDATVVLREHGEMQWWNTAARRLLGLRWPQDQGQRIDNLFRHPEFRAFLEVDSGKEALTLPSPMDSQLMLEIRVVPYGDRQRLLIARDITRLYRLERTRRDFVANISHELRTPLTVIHGLAETLADDDQGADPALGRALHLIEQQTQRMRRLVDDLLLLSRLETEQRRAEPQRVNVPVMLQGLIEEAKAIAGRTDQVVALDADPGLMLRGEEGELRSAFSNLVFNALKYTPAGGNISVRWYEDAGGVHFSVKDSGEGIAAHHIPRLTERFYRVDSGRHSKTGGTGLGLAIVKHVLHRHEGHLHVESRLGRGSEFRCDFPAGLAIRTAARPA